MKLISSQGPAYKGSGLRARGSNESNKGSKKLKRKTVAKHETKRIYFGSVFRFVSFPESFWLRFRFLNFNGFDSVSCWSMSWSRFHFVFAVLILLDEMMGDIKKILVSPNEKLSIVPVVITLTIGNSITGGQKLSILPNH